MKKLGILLVALAIAIPASAADKLGFGVERTLASALQNERQAALRYEAFMAQAEQEGYPGAANLFRACAKAERIHARRFKAALEQYGAAVPAEPAYTPSVGDTRSNLRAAMSGEQSERDSTYREANEVAKAGRNPDVARLFEVTRDTETEHANLLASAASSLEELKQPKAYWLCEDCGFTTDVRLPLCPSCRVRHELELVKP
jgi:rubrerythrin